MWAHAGWDQPGVTAFKSWVCNSSSVSYPLSAFRSLCGGPEVGCWRGGMVEEYGGCSRLTSPASAGSGSRSVVEDIRALEDLLQPPEG